MNPRTFQHSPLDVVTSAAELSKLALQSTEMARMAARHPSAPPKLLEKLATHQDRTVRKFVTMNPATPLSTLLTLAEVFAAEFLKNPVFELLFLENPVWVMETSISLAKTLYKLPEFASKYESALAGHSRSEVRTAVAIRCSDPNLLADLSRDADSRVRVEVARNHHAQAPILERLAADKNDFVRQACASNPSTPTESVVALAQENSRFMELGAALNPAAPPDLLDRFARSQFWDIQWAVAANPNSGPKTLTFIARLDLPELREIVAANPSVPSSLLNQLVEDEIAAVRRAARQNIRSNPSAGATGFAAGTSKTLGHVNVTGSNGEVYRVDIQNNTCTCKGYHFRKTCKHIRSLETHTGAETI